MKDKKIIITGGAGFIGRKLVDRLRLAGAQVVVLDLVNGVDVTDWNGLNSACPEGADTLYHLAGKTYIPEAWENPREFFNVNVQGTLNALELCRTRKIGRFIFMSSYVYGRPQYIPTDEVHPLQPNNPYAYSKIIGEELCRAYHDNFGLQCVVCRPFNIFGEGQSGNFLVPKIVVQAFRNELITLNDSKPKRDMLYIDDLLEALLKAGSFSAKTFEVFNIGSGRSYHIAEIVGAVASVLGRKIKVSYLNRARKDEIPETLADISKASHLLQWAPKIGLNEGIAKMIAAIKKNGK